jgi:lysozyme
MLSRYRVSRAAIELIKQFEGYRQKAAQLPDGRWTIGHGHTLTARAGAEVCETDAEALLVYDLIAVQHAVNENILTSIGQNQFDALCCFAFNIGTDNFRRSQVLKRLNAGAVVQAACAMELWRKADFEGERIVVDALVRRRAAEKALFLMPDDGVRVAAPSPLLRPVIDLDALEMVPMRRPVEVETSMVGERVLARRDDIPEPDVAPEPAAEPAPAVAAAAEAVTGRLSSLFADPGEDPEVGPLVAEPELEPELEANALEDEVRPQADFAPPITAATDVEAEPEAEAELVAAAAAEPVEALADAELDIPLAPLATALADDEAGPQVNVDIGAAEFIPARTRPAPRKREPSVVWDLLLALFGLAFFGFGIVWGMSAQAAPVGGGMPPALVAGPAGLAGVIFFTVAVFRLLQRLGREIEQD